MKIALIYQTMVETVTQGTEEEFHQESRTEGTDPFLQVYLKTKIALMYQTMEEIVTLGGYRIAIIKMKHLAIPKGVNRACLRRAKV
jgi:hypothetical protein